IDSGWLRKIIVPEGGEAVVNQPIAIFTEEKDESVEGYKPEGEAGKGAAAQPPKEPKPEQKPAEQPKKEAKPAETYVRPPAEQKTQAQPKQPPQQAQEPAKRIMASPLAKKLAAEQGLDLANLQGSGPGGRIMKRDLAEAPSVLSRKEEARLPIGTSIE